MSSCLSWDIFWPMANPSQPWTILRLIEWTKDYFARAGLEEPRLSAEMLLAHVLGCPRLALYTQFDRQPAQEQLASFRELVKRAAANEPIAYLTGVREFYSLAFNVSPEVLIPRPETELLVDAVLELAKAAGQRGLKLWDVCTGSGCVAIAAAHYVPTLSVLATDVSAAALAVAANNVQEHGLAERVRLAQADLLSLPADAPMRGPFDIITANPPYVSDVQMAKLPKVVLAEPPTALRAGPTGLEIIGQIIRQAPQHLCAGGTLAVEMGAGQAQAVYELLNQSGDFDSIRILKDAAGIERTAVAVRR